jgi:hypothetical protein
VNGKVGVGCGHSVGGSGQGVGSPRGLTPSGVISVFNTFPRSVAEFNHFDALTSSIRLNSLRNYKGTIIMTINQALHPSWKEMDTLSKCPSLILREPPSHGIGKRHDLVHCAHATSRSIISSGPF